jgi:hypothetical protein
MSIVYNTIDILSIDLDIDHVPVTTLTINVANAQNPPERVRGCLKYGLRQGSPRPTPISTGYQEYKGGWYLILFHCG